MNFGGLKTLCSMYVHRSDIDWAALAPLAAARITLAVNVQANQAIASLTLGGPDSEGRCFGPLPSDYFAMHGVRLGGDTLEPVDIKTLPDCVGKNHYAVSDSLLYTQASGTASIVYTKAETPLVADGDTSDILTQFPNVWLYALLTEAAIVMQDPELRAEYFEEQFRGAAMTANGAYLEQAFGPGMMPIPVGGLI